MNHFNPPGRGRRNAPHVSEHDLIRAYRKAKVDVFYEKDQALHLEFAAFEEQFQKRITRLRQRLIARDWMLDPEILGELRFIPKNIEYEQPSGPLQGTLGGVIHTDPHKEWAQICESQPKDKQPQASFRVISRASVEWHIISALWILRVGHEFDAALGDCVRGSRLRRYSGKGAEKLGLFHEEAGGCFVPYAPAYSRWRRDGLDAISKALERGEDVAVLTADLRRFYHETDPSFMCDSRFLSLARISPSTAQNPLHADMLTALQNWAARPLFDDAASMNRGLPIGLSAARVIANCILHEFDLAIREHVDPLYYGRYVDDIILVLRNQGRFKTANDVWQHICSRLKGLLTRSDENGEVVYRLRMSYDGADDASPYEYQSRSNLRFAGSKQKVFFLEGNGGKTLLQSIVGHIRETGSEWRELPDDITSSDDLYAEFLVAGRDAGETPDSLCKSDGITIRRLQFALKLRDLEAFAEDLRPETWEKERTRFFTLVCERLLLLPHLFTFATYVPRIVGLAVTAGDWASAKRVIRATELAFASIGNTCRLNAEELHLCRKDLKEKIYVAICAACKSVRTLQSEDRSELLDIAEALSEYVLPDRRGNSVPDVLMDAGRLHTRDLGREPFRRALLEEKLIPVDCPRFDPVESMYGANERRELTAFCSEVFRDRSERGLPCALLFPTRPFTVSELCYLLSSQKSTALVSALNRWQRMFRGSNFVSDVREYNRQFNDLTCDADQDSAAPGVDGGGAGNPGGADNQMIWIPGAATNGHVHVALPCLSIDDESWTAGASSQPDPDWTRYTRTTRLINQAVREFVRPDYIVLPELALQPRWFWRFAHRLAHHGISLISGIEYQRVGGVGSRAVVNEVLVSLVTDAPGFRTFVVFGQTKSSPSPGERKALRGVAGRCLVPDNRDHKRVFRHGDFQFGILICSELTNIRNRAFFQGRVDALFVPEWNRDIDGFSPLVESAAADLHLFVVQVNNRQFGDCRIRAPYNEERWMRDLVRLKGGMNDYFAIGKLDYLSLRRFQSCAESPKGPFKPVPDGFSISKSRRALPQNPET